MKIRSIETTGAIDAGETIERSLEPQPEGGSFRITGLEARAPKGAGSARSLIAAQDPQAVLHPFVAEMEEQSRQNAARYREANLKLLAERGVADPERELSRLEAEMRGRQQLLMRRSVRGLLGLLLDGRIKTVYEVPDKRSGPDKYLEYRRETEERLGYFEHRPCYGYVSFDDTMKAAPTEFGDVILVLDPEHYRERVVCCEFDSFDHDSRESYRSKAFLWDDAVQLVMNQMLDGTLERMDYAYDEAQLFPPRDRPLETVTIADVKAVELPSSHRFDVIAAEVRRRAPWVTVVRYQREGAEEPTPLAALEGTLEPTGAKPDLGVMMKQSELAGWYRAAGGKVLVKEGPPHQLEAEIFGASLAQAMKLRAPEVVPANVGGTSVVAVSELPGAEDVTSSWFSREQNEANLRALLADFPEARAKLLEAVVIDLVTANLDGAQNVMRDADGPCFVDFGGCAHSRAAGEIKKAKYFEETIDVALFLERLGDAIGSAHPIFDTTRDEMIAVTRKLIDRGLLMAIADAIRKARIAEDGAWPASLLLERMQRRALSLMEPSAWPQA